MELLKTEFGLNGMRYVVLERSEGRYFAEVYSKESDTLVAYETGRILKNEERETVLDGLKVTFRAKEGIIGNEKFGKCPSGTECCMTPENRLSVHENYLRGVEWDEIHQDNEERK